jgi:hypothetical protein
MAGLVIPVGQASGPVFEGAGDKPLGFEVRVGEVICTLDDDEFALWGIAHAEPERLASQQWTRRVVLNEARKAAVTKPERVFDQLVEDGLVAEVDPGTDGATAFADAHRLFPLAVGLGNDPDELETFGIGFPDEPRLGVNRHPFHLWLLAPASPSLWAACQTLAADLRAGGETDEELVSAETMLAGFLGMLPVLIATGCAFVDRRLA